MASALLVSRNEPYWGEQKVYMRKNPNSNPNPNPRLYPNPSQSANPNPSQIFDEHASSRQNQVHAMESDEPVATVAISDDSSSFNHRRDPGGYVTYNISTYTKKELRELKRRLVSELEQVRSVTSRIEARELQTSARSAGYSTSGVYGGGREVTSAAVLPSFTGSEAKKLLVGMMKKCGQILSKLMKHKGAVWFNIPVDVVAMGLHDYHLIIKTPMDLGTVRSKLSKGAYPSPVEFASDIRLTFENAIVYNPQGHEVHRFAEQLLRHFEGLFGPPYAKYEKQQSALLREEEDHQRRMQQRALETAMRVESVPLVSSPPPPPPPPIQTPVQPKPPLPPPPPTVVQPQPQAQPQPSNNNVHAHVQQQQKQQARRLPKPKARDPDKRGMTTEEKEKLSVALHNLPEDKSNHVLHIIKKRNVGMLVDGDVVEIDFEMMDNETLWELDRFVVNWEKAVKKKRVEDNVGVNPTPDSLLVNASVAPPLSVPCEGGDKSPVVADETPESLAAKKSKKGGDPVDEDVDIGDEMPATDYPSIEIEKDAGYESSSSSSGSDSSTSSDSDSGSSSGSDSADDDGDDAQPPAASSRPSPRS